MLNVLKQEYIIYEYDQLVSMVKLNKNRLLQLYITCNFSHIMTSNVQSKWKEKLSLDQDICWKSLFIPLF